MSPGTISDTQTNAAMEEPKCRADTPDSEGGGYFTLSESETGSNNGTDLKEESVNKVITISKRCNQKGFQRQKSQDLQLAFTIAVITAKTIAIQITMTIALQSPCQ